MHADRIPETLRLIFDTAFTGQAAVGGFMGAGVREAIRYGIARGLFSNESGLGSAPIVAAAAQTKNPVRQALVSSTGTFWDTVVVCAMTGLVVVNSVRWTEGAQGRRPHHAPPSPTSRLIGPMVLSIGLLTFVFSTILGWSYYGEKAAEYLFGERAVKPYRLLWVVAVMVGSVATLPAVWAFADIANGLMAVPNLVSLIALSGVAVAETRTISVGGRPGLTPHLATRGGDPLELGAERRRCPHDRGLSRTRTRRRPGVTISREGGQTGASTSSCTGCSATAWRRRCGATRRRRASGSSCARGWSTFDDPPRRIATRSIARSKRSHRQQREPYVARQELEIVVVRSLSVSSSAIRRPKSEKPE